MILFIARAGRFATNDSSFDDDSEDIDERKGGPSATRVTMPVIFTGREVRRRNDRQFRTSSVADVSVDVVAATGGNSRSYFSDVTTLARSRAFLGRSVFLLYFLFLPGTCIHFYVTARLRGRGRALDLPIIRLIADAPQTGLV